MITELVLEDEVQEDESGEFANDGNDSGDGSESAKAKNPEEKENGKYCSRRNVKLKVKPNNIKELASILEFHELLNGRMSPIQKVIALILGWITDKELEKKIRSQLEASAKPAWTFLTNYEALAAENQALVRGYSFFLVLCGARAWDPLRKVTDACRSAESAKKTLSGLIEARKKEQTKLQAEDAENPRLLRVAKELELLEDAEKCLDRALSNSIYPFSPLLQLLDGILKHFQKLIPEAAFQVLSCHHGKMEEWQEKNWKLQVEEAKAKKDSDYQAYLKFRKTYSKLFKQEDPTGKLSMHQYVELLKRPEIRQYRKEKTDKVSDVDVQELGTVSQLCNASDAIMWFNKQNLRYLKFRKGPGKFPTLTFSGKEHQFNFTFPGPRTVKGSYSLTLSASSDPVVTLLLCEVEGKEFSVSFPVFSNPQLSQLQVAETDFIWNDPDLNKNANTPRKAYLGGLRLRPKQDTGEIFLDLVVNIERDPWDNVVEGVTFDKEGKFWKIPAGTVVASVLPRSDGTVWFASAVSTGQGFEKYRVVQICLTEKRFNKLPMVTFANGGGRRRNATTSEFGQMIDYYCRHGNLSAFSGADEETLQVLKLHIERRNQRAQGGKPNMRGKYPQTVGALFTNSEHVDKLVGLNRRLSNELKAGLPRFRSFSSKRRREVSAENNQEDFKSHLGRLRRSKNGPIPKELDQHLQIMARVLVEYSGISDSDASFIANFRRLRCERNNVIRELKGARRHLLNCVSNRLKMLVHEVTLRLKQLSEDQKVHLLLLPAKSFYQRGIAKFSKKQNRRIGIARLGDFCERLANNASVLGVKCIRQVMSHVAQTCPRCHKPGVVFQRRGGQCKHGGAGNIFGCVTQGCIKECDVNSATVENMIDSLVIPGFSKLPEGTPRPKWTDYLKKRPELKSQRKPSKKKQ